MKSFAEIALVFALLSTFLPQEASAQEAGNSGANRNESKTESVTKFNPKLFEDSKAKLIRAIAKDFVNQKEAKGFVVYGIRLGDSINTYSADISNEYQSYIPGTHLASVNLEASRLEIPAPLTRREFVSARVFALVNSSNGIIIGVGITAKRPTESFAKGMRQAAKEKCVTPVMFDPSEHQGVALQARERLGEVLGATDNGVVVSFTDRTRPAEEFDQVTITYIDPFLASKIGPPAIDPSGF